MKILLLTKKFPYPLREGEPIAITNLARSLAATGCEVTLLVMNTSKHYFDPAALPAAENHYHEIHSVTVDNRIRFFGALKSWLTGQSYILDRFRSATFGEKLAQLLRQNRYDVVQLETVYLAHYLPVVRANSTAIVSMRAHNVEHEIWERVAATTPNFFKKMYLRNQNRHLRQFEIAQLRHYDVLLAITERDLKVFQILGFKNERVVAPVGINLEDYVPDFQCFNQKKSAAFIGALDWMPNQHGVVWFLENVWRKIAERCPEAEFHIAGKNTPDWLRAKANDRTVVHGEVVDAKSFINAHPVLVAPLFSGSGIKIKVLEGMALGRTVITTPIGAEGIPATAGVHFLIAETAEEFEKHLVWCFENPLKMMKIGLAARQFIGDNFDNPDIAERVVSTYQKLVAR